MSHPIRIFAAAACLLLLPLPVQAHHGHFYKRVFDAIEKEEVEKIQDLFANAAWAGKEGAMSAADLQKRLKRGKRVPVNKHHAPPYFYELSSRDKARSKCLVYFELEYPDRKIEQIWILAEDIDPRERSWDWRIVRIVDDEKEAQAFFQHRVPRDFFKHKVPKD